MRTSFLSKETALPEEGSRCGNSRGPLHPSQCSRKTRCISGIGWDQGLLLHMDPHTPLHNHSDLVFPGISSPALEEVAISRWGQRKPCVPNVGRDPNCIQCLAILNSMLCPQEHQREIPGTCLPISPLRASTQLLWYLRLKDSHQGTDNPCDTSLFHTRKGSLRISVGI